MDETTSLPPASVTWDEVQPLLAEAAERRAQVIAEVRRQMPGATDWVRLLPSLGDDELAEVTEVVLLFVPQREEREALVGRVEEWRRAATRAEQGMRALRECEAEARQRRRLALVQAKLDGEPAEILASHLRELERDSRLFPLGPL